MGALDSSGSVAANYEHANRPWGSIKCGEFLEHVQRPSAALPRAVMHRQTHVALHNRDAQRNETERLNPTMHK